MGLMKRMATPGGKGGMGLSVRYFFDKKKVVLLTDKANRRALSHIGAFVRGFARRSIKKAPKSVIRGAKGRFVASKARRVSRPGNPPYTHPSGYGLAAKGFLRADIIFAYDPILKSVVVGPHTKPWLNKLHEFGGMGRRGGVYPARPYMEPALMKSLPKFRQLYPQEFRKAWRSGVGIF